MSVDLRTNKKGGTWVKRFGSHEARGVEVSVSNESANITMPAIGIMFVVDRDDVPAAWDKEIDVEKLHAEFYAAIARRMTPKALEELFSEFRVLCQRAFWNGNEAAKDKMKEALGL